MRRHKSMWIFLFLLGLTTLAAPTFGQAKALSLSDVIRLSEQYSPDLKAALSSEQASSESIRVNESRYFPTLDFAALDSTGFPASARPPADGFNGLIDSPYRSGWSLGGFSTLTLFDLTREFGVQAAKANLTASVARTSLTMLQLDMTVANLYLDTVRDQALRESWAEIQSEIERVYDTVKKFVRNGQYSEVTEWLLKYQREQAIMKQATYAEATAGDLRQLEILCGMSAGTLVVSGIDDLKASLQQIQPPSGESPFVLTPRLDAVVSQSQASQQNAQNFPRLLGIASAGTMDDSRVVPKQNYSAWIGFTVPIFEGFRISAEVQRARAQAEQQTQLANQAELQLQEADTRYLTDAKTRDFEVQSFQTQNGFSREALRLSLYRYRTFVGNLADVRDSLYSYEASKTGLDISRVESYRAKLLRALISGSRF